MPRIKVIATLIAAAITSAPGLAQIQLPNAPADQGYKIDVQKLQQLDLDFLNQRAHDFSNAGSDTFLTISGDSGGSGRDISFMTKGSYHTFTLFLGYVAGRSGITLDLVQPDDIQLTNIYNSPADAVSLFNAGKAAYYIKHNAGTLTNRGLIEGLGSDAYVGVWFGTDSTTRALINSGTIDMKGMVGVAIEGRLETLNNSGSLVGGQTGVYVSSTGSVRNIINDGTIKSTQGYAVYNEGEIKGITGSGTYENGIYNVGTIVLNNNDFVNSALINEGTLTISDETSASATLTGNLTNSGNLILNPTSHSAGNTLTINGNYTGAAGSTVSLGSVLAGDNSLTDKLVVTGDTSGESTLNITNESGSGAQTLEGIQVISVGGHSDALFKQGGRVVAGAWDYTLRKGNVSGSDNKGWYLTSYAAPVTPGTTTTPGTTSTPVTTTPGTTTIPVTTTPVATTTTPVTTTVPGMPDTPAGERMMRPEAGSYVANLQAVRSLFTLSLHDRVGETQYTDALTGEPRTTSLWMRHEGGHNASRLADGQDKTTASRYVLQLGGDVMQLESDNGAQVILGVTGGYADQHSHTHNTLTGYDSRGSVNGYSAGLYSTWYQNLAEKAGLYLDSWAQYGWFNNEVKGQGLAPETYKSQGLSGGTETGYNWRVTGWQSNGIENSVWLQPHAQIIWSGVKADEHTESNGTRVSGTDDESVQTKLGLRAFLNGSSVLDKDTGRVFEPFVEANWLYSPADTGVSLNGEEAHLAGTRNVGELKAGIEGKLGRDFSAWTNVAQQIGGNGYSDTQGVVGLKYQF